MSAIQRARMLAAMAEVASELGLANVTVAHVTARSGVSRRTFYEMFADRDDCFLAALDAASDLAAARVAPAFRQDGRWRDRLRASLGELLGFLDDEPHLARLLFVQTLGAGPAALERRQRLLAQAIAAVDEGRIESKARGEPPELTAEATVGAVFSIVHSRLLDEKRLPLAELTSELMAMIVLPYLGTASSRRELALPAPSREASADAGSAALRDLGMRLTYRTVRVLLAIGEHPGASNRRVADVSDIHDQGQVSKLLRRLRDLGLIRNVEEPRVTGEANAWTLTERGASVRDAISVSGRMAARGR